MAFLLYLLVIAFVAVLGLLSIGMFLLGKVFGGVENAIRIIRQLFGMKTASRSSQRSTGNRGTSNAYSSATSGSSSRGKSSAGKDKSAEDGGKMFGNDEGEYVDYEEVK